MILAFTVSRANFSSCAGKSDKIEGVSECVILGQSIGLGTGAFGLVRALALNPGDVGPKETLFERVWHELEAKKAARFRTSRLRGG